MRITRHIRQKMKCCFSSMHGQLSGNHFLTILEGLDDLYDFGRKVLYEGAQLIRIETV